MAKRAIGRPRILKSPEQFVERAERYFRACAQKQEIPNVTGLALGVGLCSRQSLDEYQARPDFTDSIKRAKALCELALLEGTIAGAIPPAVGIFILKNFGWTDRYEIDQTVTDRTGVAQVSPEVTVDAWAEEYGDIEIDEGADPN